MTSFPQTMFLSAGIIVLPRCFQFMLLCTNEVRSDDLQKPNWSTSSSTTVKSCLHANAYTVIIIKDSRLALYQLEYIYIIILPHLCTLLLLLLSNLHRVSLKACFLISLLQTGGFSVLSLNLNLKRASFIGLRRFMVQYATEEKGTLTFASFQK